MTFNHRLALPLLTAIAVTALSAAPDAGASDAPVLVAQAGPSWIESVEPRMTPAAEATPEPEPTPTPTPMGAFFTGMVQGAYEGDNPGEYKINLYIEGAAAGERPVTFAWAAPSGKLSANSGENVIWYAPSGKRAKPLQVPITVTVTDGVRPMKGRVIVTVAPSGEAEVTKVEIPGLSSDPDDFVGCFPAGTQVRLADGSQKAIEAIKVGDRLAAYDEAAGKPAEAKVQQVLVHREKTYSLSQLRTDDGHVLTATGDHPIFTSTGEWKHVDQLKPGEQILVFQGAGQGFKPTKIVSVVKDWSQAGVVYNLKTSQHDYVAAEILVHNKCLAAGTLVDAPGGPVPVESLAPGMAVYAYQGGERVVTRVTNLYTKETVAPTLPGKRLAPGVTVTINHMVHQQGAFRPAGEGAYADVAIAGAVYDVQTEAGNYYAGGFLMTASDAVQASLAS